MNGKKFFDAYNMHREKFLNLILQDSQNSVEIDSEIFAMCNVLNTYLTSMKIRCGESTYLYKYICKKASQMLNKDLPMFLNYSCDFINFTNKYLMESEILKTPETVVYIYNEISRRIHEQVENNEFGDQTPNIAKQSLDTLDYMIIQYTRELKKHGSKRDMKKFIECLSGKDISIPIIFLVIPELSGIYNDLDKKMNTIIESNKDEFAKWILTRKSSQIYDLIRRPSIQCKATEGKESGIADKYCETMIRIIDELLENCNKKYVDIKTCGEGGYAVAYLIGNKVLKVGAGRETKKIPYHRRILQPVIRMELEAYESNNPEKPGLFIEIADNVEVNWEKCKDYIMDICKELYRDGIVWTDPKPGNVGILKRFNIPTLHGEDIYVAPEASGIEEHEDEILPLQKGDIVIIDTDFLYKVGDKNIQWGISSEVDEFRQWYDKQEKLRLAAENR